MEDFTTKKIIAITGLMGVGKTTLGMRLAEKLNYYFIDSDQEIEDREQSTITEIFSQKGEKYFRNLEKNIIKEIISGDEEMVLALGGGAFLDKEIRNLLKEKAITIWLYADVNTILHRIGNKGNRPLLNNKNKRKALEDLIRQRYQFYTEADMKFDTVSKNHNYIVSNIVKKVDQKLILNTRSKVIVELDKRSYDIIIGSDTMGYLPTFLKESNYSKIFVITDTNVAKFHVLKISELLKKTKLSFDIVTAEASEQTKSFYHFEKISEEILQKGLDRKSLIIAFGGGVVGDLSGFVASVLLRGIDFVQIPTTLLAMVDSSVGGKTAINSKFGKNLIGSFYQPKLVICDLGFLGTLPARDMYSGYAEIVKYGLIYDKNFFEFLEKNLSRDSLFGEAVLQKIITRSCEIKAEIVSKDEKESGLRAILNFGHSFGHIFETETNYSSELLHGEAVAMGMVMAAKMSLNLKMIHESDFNRIKSHIEKFGFITDPKKLRQKWNLTSLTNHIFKDKKNENQNLTFILLERVGSAIVKKSVPLEDFKKILQEFCHQKN